jgi:uncharacterized membrane protein
MKFSFRLHWKRWLAVALVVLVTGAYVRLTPPGLLTKADMVGYAVCHRIPSHSFAFGDRQFPLCARCSGTFLGALTGLLGQVVVLRRRRESEFPPPAILALLVGFILLMGADGLNSYLNLIGAPYLYEPKQWLRLVTGALNGLALSGILLPMVHFSLWKAPSPDRVIQRWRDLGVLLAMEAGVVALMLTQWPPLLCPLALAGAAGVLTMLSLVNTVLAVMLTGHENQYHGWKRAITPLLVGISLALLQVGLIDLTRYWLTGTLESFPGLGP